MPDDDLDPSASTQMFQAFVDRQEPEASGQGRKRAALVIGVLVALVVVLAIAWYLLGG
jgi:Flp pilus assembly protein TadB